jgi:uncharacterized RDD family membrane protein YckC
MFLDGLITTPLVLLIMLNTSRLLMVATVMFSFIFEVFYEVYLVRRFGGTPGKLIVGLRILKTDGSPVGYREAALRVAPDMTFSFLGIIGLLIALSKMTNAEYSGFLNAAFYSQLVALSPAWSRGVSIIERVWNWGELIVLQTNRKKRALHDFIAGTVVVQFAKHAGSPAIRPTLFPSEGV